MCCVGVVRDQFYITKLYNTLDLFSLIIYYVSRGNILLSKGGESNG